MTFLKMAAATALFAALPLSAMAQSAPTAAECEAWFAKADTNKDGSLGGSGEEASKYADLMSGGSSQGQSSDGGSSGSTASGSGSSGADSSSGGAASGGNSSDSGSSASSSGTGGSGSNSGGGSGNNNADYVMQKSDFIAACGKGSFGMPKQ